MPNPWTLIQSFTAAGTYSWVAPDESGGDPYQVGYYVIGGGGSGGAALSIARSCSALVLAASGGASGRTVSGVFTVTPGNTYLIRVGAGAEKNVIRQSELIRYAGGIPGLIPSCGSSAAVFSGTSVINGSGSVAPSVRLLNGNSGEASFFNGFTAPGGSGGFAALSAAFGASGGQGSDAAAPAVITAFPIAPSSGRQTASSPADPYAAGGATYPLEAMNPFESYHNFLIAGGAACVSISLLYSTLFAQLAGSATFGSGSPGTAVKDNVSLARTVIGDTPTAYGAGSGGVVLDGYSKTAARKAVVTGAGAPGAVFLYY